jgi:hypothetical protein
VLLSCFSSAEFVYDYIYQKRQQCDGNLGGLLGVVSLLPNFHQYVEIIPVQLVVISTATHLGNNLRKYIANPNVIVVQQDIESMEMQNHYSLWVARVITKFAEAMVMISLSEDDVLEVTTKALRSKVSSRNVAHSRL